MVIIFKVNLVDQAKFRSEFPRLKNMEKSFENKFPLKKYELLYFESKKISIAALIISFII